jgi:hypothetical protein
MISMRVAALCVRVERIGLGVNLRELRSVTVVPRFVGQARKIGFDGLFELGFPRQPILHVSRATAQVVSR